MAAVYTIENHNELLGSGRRSHEQIDQLLDNLAPGRAFIEFAQNEPASVWTIDHELGRRPKHIVIYDVNDDELEGAKNVSRDAPYRVTITFNQPYAGTVILS